MSFFICLIVFGLTAIVFRILREQYEWVETIIGILWFVVVITAVGVWIANGFFSALGTFVVLMILMGLLFGTGTSEMKHGEHNFEISCLACGYGKFYTLDKDGCHGLIRCKRCGKTTLYQISRYGGGGTHVTVACNNCSSGNLEIWEESQNSVITHCKSCGTTEIRTFRPNGGNWKVKSQVYRSCKCGGFYLKIVGEDIGYVAVRCKKCGTRYTMYC